jgi:hypothetical protein
MKSKFEKIPIMTSLIGTFSLLTLLFVSQTAVAQETLSPEFEEEATSADAGTAQIVGSPEGVNPSAAIIHANEAFDVQWRAVNVGTADSVPFTDSVKITHWPEGASDSCTADTGEVVYDSQTASDPTQFDEAIIPANTPGPLMVTNVGPFPAGWVNVEVTFGAGVYDAYDYNCFQISAAQ